MRFWIRILCLENSIFDYIKCLNKIQNLTSKILFYTFILSIKLSINNKNNELFYVKL